MQKLPSEVEPEISTFLHAVSAREHQPVSGTFELTSRCNFNCKMCYIHDQCSNASEELTASQWINIAKEACDMGVLFVLLTGGEPLIRDDFEEIYCKVKEMGTIVSLNTNASLLSGGNLELLKRNPPSRINISLYGASNETYNNLTGTENFDRVIYNIRNAKRAGLPLKINLCLTPYNIGDVEKIFEIANELDIYVKSTAYMYPPVRRTMEMCGQNSSRFSPDEAAFYRAKVDLMTIGEDRFLERVEKLKQGIAEFENECVDISLPGKENGVSCRAGTSSFWINYKGEMSPCGIFGKTPHSVINDGVKTAWTEVMKDTSEIRLPKKCLSCKYRMLCNVCAAVCYSETGDFGKAPEYVCEYSKCTVKHYLNLAQEISRGKEGRSL